MGLIALLLLTWLSYHPGLSGGFLFDDLVNLDALGNSGRVDNWPTLWRYLTSGTADPTGRPLALLSFLIDARDWPADPAPFLRSNVLLHLANGALLFALLRRLGRALGPTDARNDSAALIATGLWLLHPLFVSTTLYIVQREAMLPVTFVLLGLLAYDRGRMRLARTHGKCGTAWMVCGIGLGTALSLLCKANGVLLPLLAWVLEATIYQPDDFTDATSRPKFLRRKGLLLILPSLLIFAYVASFLPTIFAPQGFRPWTIGQRLLTEPRVLVDYLKLLVVPRSVSTGLYNDEYQIARDLWHPASTVPALLIVSCLIVLGFASRRRAPTVSAALLFFFAGHLLESTTIPLELFFEHRNYLPALLLFWPLARALCVWKTASATRVAVAVALLALFAITTHQRAELWGRPQQLAMLWAKQNPESSRAQATLAMAEISAGNSPQALARLLPIWNARPHDLQIAFNTINAACDSSGLSRSEAQALARALRHADGNQLLTYQWISNAIDIADSNQCPGLTLADTESWVGSALLSPAFKNSEVRDQDLEPLLAQIAIRMQQPTPALRHFDLALIAFTTPDVAARQASQLASNGYYREALSHLDTYERLKRQIRQPGLGMPRLHAKVLEWEHYWPYEMALLRSKLKAAKAEQDVNANMPR